MAPIIKEVISGTGSACLFLVLFFFGMPWWMSLGLAGAGYFAVRIMLPPERQKVRVVLPAGVGREEFDDFMARCRRNLALVRGSAAVLTNKAFQDTVYRLCDLSDDLVLNFAKDPADMRAALVFPDRLGRLHAMLTTYIDLSGQKSQSAQTLRALKTTESAVAKAVSKFEDLHHRLLENDAIDLSTSAKTFDNLLDLD